jgi:hypothetical protein
MNLKKNLGIILWISVCIIGAVVYGLIFLQHLKSIDNFYNLSVLDSIFVFFIVLVFSLVFSVPFIIYILIRQKLFIHIKSRVLEYNIVFTIYIIGIYFIFSFQMVSFYEGFQLISTFFIVGLIALNIYLRKLKKSTHIR